MKGPLIDNEKDKMLSEFLCTNQLQKLHKMKKEEKMEDHVDLSVKDIGEELKEKQKL